MSACLLGLMRFSPAVPAAVIVAAIAPAAASGSHPLTSVHVAACQLSPTRTDRSATFVGTMEAMPGADRMAMRFTLLVRAPGGRGRPVNAPALLAWRKSRPGVRSFTYTQIVNGLATTGVYRTMVSYRWIDRFGHVIRTASRVSPVCSEFGPLNDVKIVSVTTHPSAEAGTDLYAIELKNTGDTTQRGLRVHLYVNKAAGSSAAIDSLPAGATTTVDLTGTACTHLLHVVVERTGDQQRSVLGWQCPGHSA